MPSPLMLINYVVNYYYDLYLFMEIFILIILIVMIWSGINYAQLLTKSILVVLFISC